MSDNVTIILGPPGTGKTTALLNIVDDNLRRNTVNPREIGFISFTRKSVNEARDRAIRRFKRAENEFNYFRTIHSLAFRQLGLSNADVFDRPHYRRLGNEIGLQINCSIKIDTMVYEMGKGDQMVFIESLSRLCCEPLQDTYDRINPDLSWEELDLFSRSLESYKRANLLYDFTDMLTRYLDGGYVPKLKLLLVDEAQDLCPLQWKIVNTLIKQSNKTYIAGDDDQAIFRWSGADVKYFIDMSRRYTVKTLKQSYRLPRNIYNLALKISGQISERNEKEFNPTKIKGDVIYCNSLDDVNMSSGEWLILVRNIYMASEILTYVRTMGYSYEGFGDVPRGDESLHAALTWEKLRRGDLVTIREARIVLSYMSRKKLRGNVKRALVGRIEEDKVDMVDLERWCGIYDTTEIWHRALDKISPENREYYVAARRRGESLVGKSRIKVSTIHGTKGGEADNVILFTDMSVRTYNGMIKSYDDEARVFYVGVTRALKSLYIIQPRTPYYFTL